MTSLTQDDLVHIHIALMSAAALSRIEGHEDQIKDFHRIDQKIQTLAKLFGVQNGKKFYYIWASTEDEVKQTLKDNHIKLKKHAVIEELPMDKPLLLGAESC